jgi:hypothetical protein
MLERPQTRTQRGELNLVCIKIEVKGIAAYFTMDDALAVVNLLQALARAYGKIQKVLETNRRIERKVVFPDCLPSVLEFPGPIEGRPKVY